MPISEHPQGSHTLYGRSQWKNLALLSSSSKMTHIVIAGCTLMFSGDESPRFMFTFAFSPDLQWNVKVLFSSGGNDES